MSEGIRCELAIKKVLAQSSQDFVPNSALSDSGVDGLDHLFCKFEAGCSAIGVVIGMV